MRINYTESDIEENSDMINRFRNEYLPEPISIKEAGSKKIVDKKFIEPSIIQNTTLDDFKEKNRDNVRFVKVNIMAAVGEHLTTKLYVDQAHSNSVDESSVLRLYLDEKTYLDE